MSGIAGIYYLDEKPVEWETLSRMVDRLVHRGPDGADVWCSESIGLGHRMLWTTPESLLEKLPLVSRSGDLAITADARIDNRDELIGLLRLKDYPAEKITDSQLILTAYEKWGESCSQYLLGDFAFAIWDRRKQTLFCGRDHFGVKPFYYYYCPGQIFVFATEIKALFCLAEVPCLINETRIGDHLNLMLEDKAITFYRDIFRLPPSHSLTVSSKKLNLQQYWSFNPKQELRLNSDAEYAEAYHAIFTKAVKCRLRSAFPIGSTLSGGLDSSSIVCVSRELLAQQGRTTLKTFSAIFDKLAECDERQYINEVVAQGGVEPHYIHAERISPLTEIDKVLWHQDEPFFAPNEFMHWGLYKAAREKGVRVFLDGFLGDSVVSYGWEYQIELARKGRWLALAREEQAIAKNYGGDPWKLTRHIIWQYGIKFWIPEILKQSWQRLHRHNIAEPPISPLINFEFAERINLGDRLKAFERDPLPSWHSVRKAHYLELVSGGFPLCLELADKGAAAFSLESRFPYTDRRLAEFCLAVPPAQKLRDGWTRTILRRAMSDYLPEKIRWRSSKGNIAANFHQGLLNRDRQLLEETIFAAPKTIEPYVNISALKNEYQKYLSQGSARGIPFIWLVVTLALWLRSQNFSSNRELT